MALSLVNLTELDAVNTMLLSIGQAPVNSLDTTGIRDVAIAELVLHNTMRAVLAEGWSFNTDYALELTPDANNRVLVAADVLTLDPTNPGKDYVQRYDSGVASAMCLYDLTDHTFDITSVVKVDIAFFYSFEQIPFAARNYIATKAARIFQAGSVGSELLFRFEQVHEDEARVGLMRTESRVKDRNMLTGSPDFTAQIFHRRRNP